MIEVTLTLDRALNAWTLHCVRVAVSSSADLIAWRTLLETELGKLGDARVDLLIDLGGVSLDPRNGMLFFSLTLAVCEPRARTLLLYGRLDVRSLAFGASPQVIEPTRELALRSLQRIRDMRSHGMRPSFPTEAEPRTAVQPRVIWLQGVFDVLNQQFFDGRLARAEIAIVSPKNPNRATSSHADPSQRVIALEQRHLSGDESSERALLHEMVHYALSRHGSADFDHGERFVELANAIGAKLAARRISARTADAADWPGHELRVRRRM